MGDARRRPLLLALLLIGIGVVAATVIGLRPPASPEPVPGVPVSLPAPELQKAPPPPPRVVLGYYPSWVAHPDAKEIRYDRFTHLAHAFVKADAQGRLKEDKAIPHREVLRRAHEKGVKVLLSLGGAGSAKTFRAIARDDETRARYVDAVAALIRDSGYDGVANNFVTYRTCAGRSARRFRTGC